MTHIDLSLDEPMPDPAAARAQMAFSADAPRIGVEIEYHMLDTRRHGAPARDERVRELKEALRRQDILTDDEIAGHMVEVKTEAYTLADIHELLHAVARMERAVAATAESLGLRPVATADMAGLTKGRALKNLIGPTSENPGRGVRARVMMAAIRAQGAEDMIAYPLLNVSAQVSVTATGPQHLYDMARRHYVLLPVLMAMTHNRVPAFHADGTMDPRHGGIVARRELGRRGLVPSAFISSRNAEDYIQRTLDAAYSRPMFCYIDAKGAFNAVAAGQTVTMAALRAEGLATRANAQLTQSMDWTSVKIKTVPGARTIRAEMRDIDTGPGHAAALAAVNALMNMDAECGRAVDSLLAGYGYAGAPLSYADMMIRDLKRVEEAGSAALDGRYGHGFMRNFARELMATLAHHARRHGLEEALAPLRAVADGAPTPAQRLAADLGDMGAVRRRQRSPGA